MFKTVDGELKVFNKTILSTQNNLKNLQTQTANLSYYTSGGNHVNLQNVPIAQPQTVSNFTKLNNAFNVYNSNLTKSTGLQNAYIKSVGTQNQALGNYLAGLKGAPASFGGYIAALTKAKLATIGLHAASIALNMALTMGVAVAISALFKGIDYLIHRTEKMQEVLENSVSEFNSVTDELKSLEEELKTTTERLAELQKLADNGTISVAEEAELENLKKTNKELARKIALKQQDQAQEARDVLKDSRKNANSTVSSKYNRKTTSSGNSEYGVSVTPDEELELAIKAYETNSKALENNRGTNLEGWYEDQTEAAKNRIEEMYDLISPTIDAYEDLINAGIELEGEDKTRYEQLKKTQDAYLAYIYTLNGTKEAFEGLNAEQQRNVLLNRLIKQGLSEDVAKAIIGSISDEDLSKYWDKNFSFVPPEMKDGETAEEYGKRYAEAWAKGLEEGAKNANEMTVSLSEMEKASDKISKLGSAFKELSDDGYITTKTLGELQTATGLSGDEWAEYENRLLNAKKGSADFNQVLSELTYKILENEFATIDLTNATDEEITAIENKIAATLRENGVENANAVAHEYVRMARVNAAIAAYDGTQASYDSAAALISESLSAEQAKVAMNQLELAKINVNNAKITSSDDIDNIIAIANAALASEQTLKDLALAKAQLADDFVGPVSKSTMDIMNGTYEFEFDKLDPSDFKVDAPRYTGGSSKSSSSDKNKPEKVDNTEAIIDRINLRQRELAQQEEEIQNLIEIAELEKDYEKQISLTNDLIASRKKRVDELNKANAGLHNEAEWLRNSTPQWNEEEWFDSLGNATKAYNTLYNSSSKEQQELIKDQFEKISKYQKAYMSNTKEIANLNKEILQDEQSVVDLRFGFSKDWIEERNRLGDWHLFDDNEVKAWERVIKWLKEEYPHAVDEIKEAEESLFEARENNLNDVLDDIQRHADNVADYYDKINDKLDDRITKEEALLQIMQGQTDATSKLMDVQTEIDKAIRDSRISLQYLDKKEREGIFNEKDYTKLSKLVKSTQNEIDSLSSRFYNDVIEAYEQDKAYLIETITAEYERQVAMKERELEIAQAQVDLTKKQIQLNNVLAEKNVKQLVERNGQYVWEWVADTDKVRQATEELMDAEAELKRQEYEQKQQEAIDEQQRRIDSIKAEQAANDYRVEKMNEYVDDLSKAIENCVDPIKSFEELAMQLGDAGGDIVNAFYKVVGSISGMGVKTSSTSSSSSSSGGSGGGNSWMGNGKSYDTKTDYMSKILGASNKMDVVEYNNARNNKIDGEGMSEGKLSNSQAIKLWESAKNKHADGTRYTPGGLTALGEEGFEAFINRNGHLIPITQPTIGNIDSGGVVFNTEQMSNLRSLWDMSNIGKVNIDAALVNRTIPSGNSGTQNTFTGGIIINAPRDYNDFIRQLTQRIKTKSI